jgi:hypothetical protein
LIGCAVGGLYSLLAKATWCDYGPHSRLGFSILLPALTVHRIFYWMGFGNSGFWLVLDPVPTALGSGTLSFTAGALWYSLGLTFRQARWVFIGMGLLLFGLIAGAILSAERGSCCSNFYTVAPNGDRFTAIGLYFLAAGFAALGVMAFVKRMRREAPATRCRASASNAPE